MNFYPHELAAIYLAASGIDYDEIYNGRDGMQRAQLTAMSALPYFKKDAKKNAYKTIHRLDASKNKKGIDFGANLKNTLEGTVSTGIMDDLSLLPAKTRKNTYIKWLPSSAKEIDPFHALNYGKIMTLDAAIKKGLGVRYGCQCGMQIQDKDINSSEPLKNIVKPSKTG